MDLSKARVIARGQTFYRLPRGNWWNAEPAVTLQKMQTELGRFVLQKITPRDYNLPLGTSSATIESSIGFIVRSFDGFNGFVATSNGLRGIETVFAASSIVTCFFISGFRGPISTGWTPLSESKENYSYIYPSQCHILPPTWENISRKSYFSKFWKIWDIFYKALFFSKSSIIPAGI